jgi:molecular chaperone DnaJ
MVEQTKDYYEILGIAKDAGDDEIKKAYRKLAMKWHPDQNNGDPEAETKFKEVSEAYEVLSDSQKRAAYDRMGHAAFQQGMGGGGGAGAGMGGGFGGFNDIFEEMFGDFMGARGGGQRAMRGNDVQFSMEIDLEDAYAGKRETIEVPSIDECDKCGGKGAEPGTSAEGCSTCGGIGRVRAQQGFFTIERTCPTCKGEGTIIKSPCKQCGGAGRQRTEKNLKVNIPAGIDDGRRIRLPGEGEAGVRGGPAGDLYVLVSIRPHKFFKRDGANLKCRAPIPVTKAALGGEVEVPTIDGKKTKVKIPQGTQTNQQFRIKGKGMPIMRSDSRGDMFVEVFVETPVNLSKKQRELLEQLDESLNEKSGDKSGNTPQSSGFFQKMRDLWEDLTE